MSISSLPLSYCGNVHPALSFSQLEEVLQSKTSLIQKKLGKRIAAGLWLPDEMTRQLSEQPALIARLGELLAGEGLICYTLNAFPFGNFHSERVKENVYLPDWSEPARAEYTVRCAEILSQILPEGVEGSISTVPLAFKERELPSDFLDQCCDALIQTARQLDDLHDRTGKVIRLAIEPEPLCVLETTPETVAFFARLRSRAGADAEVVNRHLGVCYDICHQSVEYEDVAASIQNLRDQEIRINKVHITCAIELKNPGTNREGREFLAQFAEPRYLHQTFTRQEEGTRTFTDLTAEFVQSPPAEWEQAESWRIHFHVPVQAENLGPLSTTRPDLEKALREVAKLDYAPHLEVETYTWSVMPGKDLPDVCDGLTRELEYTLNFLNQLSAG